MAQLTLLDQQIALKRLTHVGRMNDVRGTVIFGLIGRALHREKSSWVQFTKEYIQEECPSP